MNTINKLLGENDLQFSCTEEIQRVFWSLLSITSSGEHFFADLKYRFIEIEIL